jgi:hypothetical protein
MAAFICLFTRQFLFLKRVYLMMENSPELKALIRKNAHLFWYIKDSGKENLPLPVVVEFFLNYAQKEDVKSLFSIAGIENVAEIFFKQTSAWGHRSNYLPVVQNFFTLYFKKYVPQYPG